MDLSQGQCGKLVAEYSGRHCFESDWWMVNTNAHYVLSISMFLDIYMVQGISRAPSPVCGRIPIEQVRFSKVEWFVQSHLVTDSQRWDMVTRTVWLQSSLLKTSRWITNYPRGWIHSSGAQDPLKGQGFFEVSPTQLKVMWFSIRQHKIFLFNRKSLTSFIIG